MTKWYARDALWAADSARFHAGNKARDDAESILSNLGYSPLDVLSAEVHGGDGGALAKINAHRRAANAWDAALLHAESDDIVVIQFPPINHSVSFGSLVKEHARRGVRIVLLIHDIEAIRLKVSKETTPFIKRMRVSQEEIDPLRNCTAVIAHNAIMKRILVDEFGVRANRIVELGIFDYLAPEASSKTADQRFSLQAPVVIAGNIPREKAGYLYELPVGFRANIYGANLEGQLGDDCSYKGAVMPDELPNVLSGSFGLVWDGPSCDTCTGTHGSYLRVNNPHKVSLYIASGIPTIVWNESAIAPFVEETGVGFCVSSICEIPERISTMGEESYKEMRRNVSTLAQDVKSGRYLSSAICKAETICAGGH